MAEWQYGMRLRGYSIGCQPKKGLIDVLEPYDNNYYNVLVYDRELTESEMEDYELDFIMKNEKADSWEEMALKPLRFPADEIIGGNK